MDYYLADGIYPKWSTIMQTIREPIGRKNKYLSMQQEACRKYVKHAFGVLQSCFIIMKGPVRFRKKNVLHDIMTTCITLHDNRGWCDFDAPIEVEREVVGNNNTRFQEFLSHFRDIKVEETHSLLIICEKKNMLMLINNLSWCIIVFG